MGLRLPDRYAIRRHIATGGMASVWCAEDRVLGRDVAIKVLSERFAHDDRATRRFKREARAAARVSAHPHVVTIFDVGDIEPAPDDDSPRAFIVMEYLDGGTVAEALRSQAVTRSEARRWLRQAASALDHAHARGIVHRDIKPANFLLDRDRSLHVADFGIARLQSEDTITSTGEVFGTAAYLAPEQALGSRATAASDRYSLAVGAFELMTGSRPFTAPHFAAQARQHIEDQPPAASGRDRTIPVAVDGVLRRGMAKDPEARYPTAGAFVEALEAALHGRDQTPRPTAVRSPSAHAAAGARRRQSGRAVALAALAVVALGVILVITQLGDSSSHNAAQSSTPQHASGAARRRRPAKPRTSTSASSSSATIASSTAPASSTATAPPSAAALQLEGHNEMLAGDYAAAIAMLHRTLATSAPGSLTHAYALYDLGRSLLLSGDPEAAIPVLEQRLKIPNQTAVVEQTLDQALRAAGQATSTAPPSGGAAPGSVPGRAHGKGPGTGAGHGQSSEPGDGPGKGPGNGAGHGQSSGPGDGGSSEG